MHTLKPWMWWLLRFAGTYNLLAGLVMVVFYHEAFRALGVDRPKLVLPVQLTGVLVALFGVGYHLVAGAPYQNRSLLMLGFWSKLLGTALAIYTVARGQLPGRFLVVVFFADMVYLPPFWTILRYIRRTAE
jgi:hypothetical protein